MMVNFKTFPQIYFIIFAFSSMMGFFSFFFGMWMDMEDNRKLKGNDILVLTADHGIDPTTPSTDHSREYVPIIITGERIKKGIDLNTRNMSDLAASLAEYFGVEIENGKSFLKEIISHQVIGDVWNVRC